MDTVYSLIVTHGPWVLGVGVVALALYFASRALFRDRCPPVAIFVIAAASLYIVTRGAILPLVDYRQAGPAAARNAIPNARLVAELDRYMPGFRKRLVKEVGETRARRGAKAARRRMHGLTMWAATNVLTKTALHAADRPLIRMMRLEMEIVRRIAKVQPDGCYYFARNSPDPKAMERSSDLVPDDLKKRYYAVAADVIESSERDHAAPMSGQMAVPLVMTIVERVQRSKGTDAVNTMVRMKTANNSGKQAVCGAQIAVIDEILRLPEDQAGGLLRWVLAQRRF